MKNDIDNLVQGGKRVYEAAFITLACALGAGIVTLIAIIISHI